MAGYGDDSGFDAWLDANGYALPDGAPDPAVLRQRGSIYLDGLYGLRFPGTPTGGVAQERAWPRTGATTTWGEAIANDAIPQAIIDASYAAAYQEALSAGSLSVVVTPASILKRRKVAQIEREFFEPKGDAAMASTPVLSSIEGTLASLIGPARFPNPLVV